MPISGFSNFKAHLPDFSELQAKLVVARLPLITIISLILAFIADYSMRYAYIFAPSEFLFNLEPWIPIIITIVLVLGGMRTAQIGFFRKNVLLQKYQDKAYQKVVKYIFTGIPLVFGGLLYSYLPHDNVIFLNPPLNPITSQLSKSFFTLLFGISGDLIPRYIFGVIILILAIRTAARAIKDFGIDNAGMVYVYYPDEARVIDSEIYSIVRHPMYMATILISIGGFIFYFSTYSLIHLIITLVGFAHHVFIVEEKELITRLGEKYIRYKDKVPALYVKPKNWIHYLIYLF